MRIIIHRSSNKLIMKEVDAKVERLSRGRTIEVKEFSSTTRCCYFSFKDGKGLTGARGWNVRREDLVRLKEEKETA